MLPQYRLHTDLSKEAYAENLAKIASELSDLCLVLLKVPKCFYVHTIFDRDWAQKNHLAKLVVKRSVLKQSLPNS